MPPANPQTRTGRELRGLLVCLYIALWPGVVHGQTVTGRVVDGATGDGVPAAALAIVDSMGARVAVSYSDSMGRFSIELDAGGTFRVEIGQLGYVPALLPALAIPRADTVTLRVELPPSPIEVRGVEAVAAPGSSARRRMTAGTAIDREQIEALLPAPDALRLIEALPAAGLRVFEYQREAGSPIYDLCVEGTRQRSPSDTGCAWVAVFVDGTRMSAPEEGLRFLSPDRIQRMEFIPPSVAGARWGTGSQNGVLVITTRR